MMDLTSLFSLSGYYGKNESSESDRQKNRGASVVDGTPTLFKIGERLSVFELFLATFAILQAILLIENTLPQTQVLRCDFQ